MAEPRRKLNHKANGADASQPVTRVEFEKLITVLDEHGDIISELRRDLHATCRDLAENVRRDLQTQFTRIAQLQQEIDALKRR
jgi:hypothetical protein